METNFFLFIFLLLHLLPYYLIVTHLLRIISHSLIVVHILISRHIIIIIRILLIISNILSSSISYSSSAIVSSSIPYPPHHQPYYHRLRHRYPHHHQPDYYRHLYSHLHRSSTVKGPYSYLGLWLSSQWARCCLYVAAYTWYMYNSRSVTLLLFSIHMDVFTLQYIQYILTIITLLFWHSYFLLIVFAQSGIFGSSKHYLQFLPVLT